MVTVNLYNEWFITICFSRESMKTNLWNLKISWKPVDQLLQISSKNWGALKHLIQH